MSLEVCRGCHKSLSQEKELYYARIDNAHASDMRNKFTWWGIGIGVGFPGMVLAGLLCDPHTTLGFLGGLILVAMSATGVAYISYNLARQMYPYRHTVNMPEGEKQIYRN